MILGVLLDWPLGNRVCDVPCQAQGRGPLWSSAWHLLRFTMDVARSPKACIRAGHTGEFFDTLYSARDDVARLARKRCRQVMGFTWPFVAILGVLLYRKGWRTVFVTGLWGGYLAMCFSFTYPMSAHNYYHLLLVPIVALSFAPIASLVAARLRQVCTSWPWRLAAWSVVVCGLLFVGSLSVQRQTEVPDFEPAVRVAQRNRGACVPQRACLLSWISTMGER